jgi:hypothetical protein
MPETRDKRHRNDLDLFVLTLIDTGIATAYALQKEAGLSQRATIPALQRLLEASFVRPENPFQGRNPLIENGPTGDLDTDLRAALLALSIGGNRKLTVDFLRQSAEKM